MTNKSNCQKILTRYLAGECSEKEKKQIQDWLAAAAENRTEFEKIRVVWNKANKFDLNYDEEKVWDALNARISGQEHSTPIYRLNQTTQIRNRQQRQPKKDTGFSLNWLLRIAAVLLLAAGLSVVLYTSQFSTSPQGETLATQKVMRKVVAERGERVWLTLSDGTEVVLNASSIIRFPKGFSSVKRKVELVKGEAYFSVSHQDGIPFLVHTNDATIRVLGTKFNVNTYPRNKKVEVVVAEGKVSVSSASRNTTQATQMGREEVILTKGEYTQVTQNSLPTIPIKVELEPYLGWIKGMLIFDSTPLKEVLTKLGNYYDVEFEVADPVLFNRQLTAAFNKESLDKVLDVITLSMNIRYEKRGSKIILQQD